jgi:hypothetical protein
MRGIEIKGRINVGLVLIRIRSVFGIPYIRDISTKTNNWSGVDYFCFMKTIRIIFEKYRTVFLDLAKTYDKGVLKIIDDFLWMLAHKPLCTYV